jgi:hypothetical protein
MTAIPAENKSRKRRKPVSIEVGRCYRLNAWYGLGQPSDVVVYVYAIEGNKQRWVRVRAVSADHELGYNAVGYTDFLRSVHSEAPTAKN